MLKPFVNATILPAHESIKVLTNEFQNIKANILGSPRMPSSSESQLSEIDYLKWIHLYDLKNKSLPRE
mgnify:FL=1